MEGILVPIAMFAAVAVILWKYFDSKHKVRMLALEKDLVNENLKYLFSAQSAKPNRFGTLKWGLTALLIGLALLIVIPLQQFGWAQDHEGELITGVIFIGGGLAFLIYFFIATRKDKAS
ncbi:MAG: hypothetical protein C0600_07065 [Ignavibacteria bacterium]|nr:MAG: hypothetical protein C0600_07065 [Ignavibacteria bacterium]